MEVPGPGGKRIESEMQLPPASDSSSPMIFFFFCLFATSWAVPVAYGGSQARG